MPNSQVASLPWTRPEFQKLGTIAQVASHHRKICGPDALPTNPNCPKS